MDESIICDWTACQMKHSESLWPVLLLRQYFKSTVWNQTAPSKRKFLNLVKVGEIFETLVCDEIALPKENARSFVRSKIKELLQLYLGHSSRLTWDKSSCLNSSNPLIASKLRSVKQRHPPKFNVINDAPKWLTFTTASSVNRRQFDKDNVCIIKERENASKPRPVIPWQLSSRATSSEQRGVWESWSSPLSESLCDPRRSIRVIVDVAPFVGGGVAGR
jgi:hypothetical protein